MKKLIASLLCFTIYIQASSQCTSPGQTPATAFPVCGTSVFQQTTVPICVTRSVVVPGCTGADYADKNPYWYKFTCFQSGTLGFLIAPVNSGDDYDWQLYDITGRDPNEVFTNASLVVTGNWAGTFGNTGASSTGVNFIQCASSPADNRNSFAAMPFLTAGRTYLLLVSHYTDSQSGYSLSFGGGTAVITDPTIPAFRAAEAACGGDFVRIRLNKKIKCNSIAPNGSDFFITPGGPTILNATGFGCNAGFDTDSIILQLSAPLAPGTYSLNVKAGSDGNTLLDHCDNPMATTSTINFTVFPYQPTPMDSIAPLACSPRSVKLVFKNPIQCSSVAANGSDFIVNGTYPVSVTGTTVNCNNGTTKEIIVNLDQPLQDAGSFTIVLRTGTDGNTLLDECSKETPAGASLPFSVQDTVNAAFTFEKAYGCVTDTVNFFHPGGNGINSWEWNLDDGKTDNIPSPQALYTQFDTKNIQLIVSNGFCSDTSNAEVLLDNALNASFTVFEDHCPNEPVTFTGTATGKIVQHHWSFGEGGTADEQSPVYTYSPVQTTTPYLVRYTVTDSIGCTDTAERTVRVYSSCLVAVPNAFTPNGDSRNDFLRVLNAIKAEQFDFRVFNRWGQLVFQTSNWKEGWNGRVGGVPQATGTYIWALRYKHRDTGQLLEQKGTATLIR